MRISKKMTLAVLALAPLALAGCGGSSPPKAASTPASTPAASTRQAHAVPVLRMGKAVIVTMPAGLDAQGQRQFATERWTLNRAALHPDGYLWLNATVVNEGPVTSAPMVAWLSLRCATQVPSLRQWIK